MGVLRSFSLLWSRCTLMIWMVWIMIQDAPVNTESVVNKYNSGDNSVKLVQLVTNMGHIRRHAVQMRKRNLYSWAL